MHVSCIHRWLEVVPIAYWIVVPNTLNLVTPATTLACEQQLPGRQRHRDLFGKLNDVYHLGLRQHDFRRIGKRWRKQVGSKRVHLAQGQWH